MFIDNKLAVIDPVMKLNPRMKPIGKLTVSFIKKLTLLLLELFCIPIINNRNKQELKVAAKIVFFNVFDIYLTYFEFYFKL